MDYSVKLSSDFEVDADEIYTWYKTEVGEWLAVDFIDKMLGSLSYIESNPYHGVRYKNNVRKVNLEKFPDKILYKIKHDEIIVFAIFHHKRRSSEFTKRKTQ